MSVFLDINGHFVRPETVTHVAPRGAGYSRIFFANGHFIDSYLRVSQVVALVDEALTAVHSGSATKEGRDDGTIDV